MATKQTTNGTNAEAVLAARFKREMYAATRRAYRRCVRQFAQDAGCTPEAARAWLAGVGVNDPEQQ